MDQPLTPAKRDTAARPTLTRQWPRLLAALWVGTMAGFFFAFSAVVMPGLARLDSATAMGAMQWINEAVARVVFFTAFFGAPLLCLAVIAGAVVRRDDPTGWPAATGAVVYLIGVFAVTVGFNVPMNDDLARLDPAVPALAAAMGGYIEEWTAWNHVRTGSGLLAFAPLGVSLALGRRPTSAIGGGDGAPA